MLIKREDALRIVFEDHDEWEKVYSKIIDKRRWESTVEGVFKHADKYYMVYWSEPNTESQDSETFYEDKVEFTEVVQKEVVTIKWVKA